MTKREKPKLEPRGYNLEAAAERLGISAKDFAFFRLQGRIPPPMIIGNDRIWDGWELDLKPALTYARDKISGVYIVGFDNYVKIGVSTDVAIRISALQDGIPTRLMIHKILEGLDRRHEGRFHKRFSTYRTRGEWFRHEGDLAAWIEAGCP